MHKLTSNQSVIYNSENQSSGVLEIIPEQIIYQNNGSNHHNVMLIFPIKVSETNTFVGGLNYILTEDEWDTFFASLTLTSTNEFDKQQEAALLYAKSQIEGNWGLTADDWIYSS